MFLVYFQFFLSFYLILFLDYVTAITQELLFIQTLERLISCYCSSYVSLFRTSLIEVYRILNHSLNITTHAIDIGLSTTMP